MQDARASDELPVAHLQLAEFPFAQKDDAATNAPIADQEVGAASDDENGNPVPGAKADQPGEALLGFRRRPELRRPADAHRGMAGERLVELEDAGAEHLLHLLKEGEIFGKRRALFVNAPSAQ